LILAIKTGIMKIYSFMMHLLLASFDERGGAISDPHRPKINPSNLIAMSCGHPGWNSRKALAAAGRGKNSPHQGKGFKRAKRTRCPSWLTWNHALSRL
jgi:hypothetical protein